MKSHVSLGLVNPKSAVNVASILRAAVCYGVNAVFYTGQRYRYAKDFNADTKAFHKIIPTIGVEDLLECKPKGSRVVAVELVENAVPLPAFHHPDNAFYVFGPEDGSLSNAFIEHVDDVVYIPTHHCMNLAATANVLLYDRLAKSRYDVTNAFIRRSRDQNNRTAHNKL
ncbi:RNA methyltransferase [Alteromonas sp. H39]|uniref:RNA methyltransferase n=1 Tax=Alteromonas sp. H39 TaxID=3389876 RepID=UPI0039E0DBC6